MATIRFIRHGQSEGNVAARGEITWDACLTNKGEQQAEKAQRIFSKFNDIDLIVVSPLRRTIQTAQRALQSHLKKGVPVVVCQDAREITCGSDDLGTRAEDLAKLYPSINFSHLPSVWWYTNGAPEDDDGRQRYEEHSFEEPSEVYLPRMDRLREYLLSHAETYKHIVVVCHCEVINEITGKGIANCDVVATRVLDGEIRTVSVEQVGVILGRFVRIVRVGDDDDIDLLLEVLYKDCKGPQCHVFRGRRHIRTQASLDDAVQQFNEFFGLDVAIKWERNDRAFAVTGVDSYSSTE